MLRAVVTIVGLWWLSLAGCTALVDTDESSLGAAPMTCPTGQIRVCPCPGGTEGRQSCNAGGSFDECLCEVAAGGAAGSPAVAPSEAP